MSFRLRAFLPSRRWLRFSLRWIEGQLAATVLGAYFTFFALIALQGLLMWLLPYRLFRKISVAAQMTAPTSRSVEEVCRELAEEFPRAIFFMGRLIFREEKWYHRVLHNETPHAIQRRLQFEGIQAMVLPIRVLE